MEARLANVIRRRTAARASDNRMEEVRLFAVQQEIVRRMNVTEAKWKTELRQFVLDYIGKHAGCKLDQVARAAIDKGLYPKSSWRVLLGRLSRMFVDLKHRQKLKRVGMRWFRVEEDK
jgi:hypothetical protein